MEIIGVVAEFNPFHNGHKYLLDEIKKMYPDSIIILIMSGYFTQRGDVSLISKYNKTKIALEYGVDIVLELPTLYTLNSADYFASYGLYALNELGVKRIVFGSESNDIKNLIKAAKMQVEDSFNEDVKTKLKNGENYPTALSSACGNIFESNDILAISYIKAILSNKYDIEPISIKRTSDFNDTLSDEVIVSASNIRAKLKNNTNIKKYIPNYDISFINNVDEDLLFKFLYYKIITSNDLSVYLGVDEGIENKLKKEILKSESLDQLILNIKSKRYTYVRIKRMLMHILLGIKKCDMDEICKAVRVLGFNKCGQKYLKDLGNNNLVFKYDNRVRELEYRACEIYHLLTSDESIDEEFKNKPVM